MFGKKVHNYYVPESDQLHEIKKKKKLSSAQVGFELSTLACEPRALPSELLGGVNWAAHASKASVDKN